MPGVASAMPTKGAYDATTLLASTTSLATAGVNSTSVRLPAPNNGLVFILDQTDAQTDVDDTLDVKVQTLLDGTNWVDVCHFTQTLGNGTDAQRFIAKITCAVNQAMFTDGVLAAGSVRHLFGDDWRVNYVIVNPGGTAASFTFSVVAIAY